MKISGHVWTVILISYVLNQCTPVFINITLSDDGFGLFKKSIFNKDFDARNKGEIKDPSRILLQSIKERAEADANVKNLKKEYRSSSSSSSEEYSRHRHSGSSSYEETEKHTHTNSYESSEEYSKHRTDDSSTSEEVFIVTQTRESSYSSEENDFVEDSFDSSSISESYEKTTKRPQTTTKKKLPKSTTSKKPNKSTTSKKSDKTTTTDIKLTYYQKRKELALKCKKDELKKLDMTEFGEKGCQFCTCNEEGMMYCTQHIDCNDSGATIDKAQKKRMDEADITRLMFREYATDCNPGSPVKAEKCTCMCVIPHVLSCPKNCFYSTQSNIIV